MKWKIIIVFTIALTVICSCYMLDSNRILFAQIDSNYADCEVFTPENGTFDFRLFSMKWNKSDNFTCKMFEKGHAQFVDGPYTINVLEFDKMLEDHEKRKKNFLDGELEKSETVIDGVDVHRIDFLDGSLYAACVKRDSYWIYISTESPNDTAEMVNSLNFN